MKECILVVDDDREIVKAIALLLEKEDYLVLKAYDGMQALEMAAENPVQLMIIDVMMPKLDGLSAVMKIREQKNIPILSPIISHPLLRPSWGTLGILPLHSHI